MLDSFEILTTSGVVLWSKTYVPVGASLLNTFIRDVFIEDKTDRSGPNQSYRKDGQTFKWTTAKDLGLIFVAVYQSLLHISWIDKLLDNVRALFTELYKDQLSKPRTTKIDCPFDPYFERQIQDLEKTDATVAPSFRVTAPTDSAADLSAEDTAPSESERPLSRSFDISDPSRPASPAQHILTGKGGPRGSRRSRKAAAATINGLVQSSGDESSGKKKQALKGKKKRNWGADGYEDDGDDQQLDFSNPQEDGGSRANLEAVDSASWGTTTADGQFMLKDIGEEMNEILGAAQQKNADSKKATGVVGSSLGTIGGLFRNVVGGKTLTAADLDGPLKGMEDHLLKKNVAREAAVRLCETLQQDLVGTKTSNFTSIETTIRAAMDRALRKMLTPTTPLDLLHEIAATKGKRPYVISIVGVNGVGKSTNLSKICFFLLQNKLRVLIAAGDTFRSGAVEQLRVHVRNLQELTARQDAGAVDIYERGYGKDAAHIARDAVTYAASNNFDVVLIDTAGRRHNDSRLMSSLEKFAKLANPDKILMVGEALVGTDSVSQARNFDAAFGPGRRLDGFIISKCDTVGDMVGTLVSMVHATGIPVLFLGTGQHYNDLRVLRPETVVELLMRP
ncbi:P-loop containing nucleoside triphosphate hydrolase protein [Microthyrium microscopicum]|uniref:Signal recognition particle receptor subunit alpha homolog n=1 Tax=Microthyrium microscopicum TaxID=703497 RepID=A0A6A6U4T4_9PEZI|nr:P-loop containing nucleoside triphosphate hydrolase protein [Microthyrium microscopicum]